MDVNKVDVNQIRNDFEEFRMELFRNDENLDKYDDLALIDKNLIILNVSLIRSYKRIKRLLEMKKIPQSVRDVHADDTNIADTFNNHTPEREEDEIGDAHVKYITDYYLEQYTKWKKNKMINIMSDNEDDTESYNSEEELSEITLSDSDDISLFYDDIPTISVKN